VVGFCNPHLNLIAFGGVKNRHPLVGEADRMKWAFRVMMVLPFSGHIVAGMVAVWTPVLESMPVWGDCLKFCCIFCGNWSGWAHNLLCVFSTC
jgi:hypothetical protein